MVGCSVGGYTLYLSYFICKSISNSDEISPCFVCHGASTYCRVIRYNKSTWSPSKYTIGDHTNLLFSITRQ